MIGEMIGDMADEKTGGMISGRKLDRLGEDPDDTRYFSFQT